MRLGIAIGVALMALQHSVAPVLQVFGVHPDFYVVIAVGAGMLAGLEAGAAVGFVVGVYADIFLATSFGLSSLFYTVSGTVAAVLYERSHDHPWLGVAVAPCSTAVGLSTFIVVGHMSGDVHTGMWRSAWIVVVISVITALAVPALVRVVRRPAVRSWRLRPLVRVPRS